MNSDSLLKIGLSPNEALIYSLLIEKSPLPAGILARRTGIKRSLAYLVLDGLIAKELVIKDESKKITGFSPTHPKNMEKLILKKESEASLAKSAYESVYHQLQQAYEVQTGQPGVRFYPSRDGLKKLYAQINEECPTQIMLIRSTELETNEELNSIVREQVQKQVRLGIKVKIITPTLPFLNKIIPLDKERNTERRIIAREVFDTSAQIITWNETVAITTYREPIVTTVIHNSDIAKTIQTIFSLVWMKTLVDTQENMKKYK